MPAPVSEGVGLSVNNSVCIHSGTAAMAMGKDGIVFNRNSHLNVIGVLTLINIFPLP